MRLIFNDVFLRYDNGNHPESPQRLKSLGDLPVTLIESGEKWLDLVHHTDYIERCRAACFKSEKLDPDTPTSPEMWEAAVTAVGAAVLASQTDGFALVRPPGHHAHPDFSRGFCIFNNIAIAVQKLVNDGKKVLIIDLDSHLGDGTMEFFYRTSRVMYASVHQDPAFPGGGGVDRIGQGDGEGYTVNFPLAPKSGDDLFIASIKTLLPIARQFSPDMVAVSAGFDGHHKDPLLNLRFTVEAYYQAGKMITENFPGVFAVLEGGYNTEYLPRCISNFVAGVNGEKKPYAEIPTDSTILTIEDYNIRIDKLKKLLAEHWRI